MKTESEFLAGVYQKINGRKNQYITPKKAKSFAGYVSAAAAAACVICAVIFIPVLLNPSLKNGTTGTAGTESGTAETVSGYRFDGVSPEQLCETYDLAYNVFYPDYYIQTDDLNKNMQMSITGTGLKIACPSDWTYGNGYDTTVNVDRLLYKLIPKQISLTEKTDTARVISDYLSMLYGTKPDIVTERMKTGTVYYCIKYPEGPPTGELSDTELEAYYNGVSAYFFCELDGGFLLRFLLLSEKDKTETDIQRYLAMLSTAEITEGDAYHFTVELPLDRYALVMSSVPGLPFTVRLGTEADIRVTADRGTLLTWDETGAVKPFAGSDYGKTVTLYWSPLDADGTVNETKDTVITVFVLTSDNREGRRTITVTSDGTYYHAEANEFSYTG